MKVAVIGLGDIARKAYLPTLAFRPGLELSLATRNLVTLTTVADSYRVPRERCFTDLDDLLATHIDAAFVHAATAAHVEIVTRLLDAGIPTYVDKPLAADIADARTLAAHGGAPLMVGFNRRYAPAYVEAAEGPRDVVVLQKNRVDGLGPVREIIYDDFIHVVDTLRFLLPRPAERVEVAGKVVGGQLHHVTLTLTAPGCSATGIMHRQAGVDEERLDVLGAGRRLTVTDLGAGGGSWTPVAERRGVAQICTRFLDAVRSGRFPDLRLSLETHEMCERIVGDLDGAGNAGS
jgi:virulence factor